MSKKYSPFRVKEPRVYVGGDERGCHSVREEASDDLRSSIARDVAHYRQVLANQETGLVCCRTTLLINPKGRYLHAWDIIALVALMLTAVATPFEVSFVRFAPSSIKAALEGSAARWFWFNRAVDLAFIVDMVQSFFIPYRDPRANNRWVKSHRRICWNYIGGCQQHSSHRTDKAR